MTSLDAELAVAFRTLGCKVNRVESEDIAAELIGWGARVVPEAEAQVIIVNTCTVTGEADTKARKAVRAALRSPSHPVVVVTGCLAALDAGALTALDERVIVEADKERVAERVAAALAIGAPIARQAPTRTGGGFRTRALIKVEDGCDAFCSYCIVPYARGVPRSEPLATVVRSAENLVAAGASEFVLTGINLGRYRDGAAELADLVRAVAETGVKRIRLSSIEPLDLTDRLLETLSSLPSSCPHLHVPLQSGSDAVLHAMRRNYTISEYVDRINLARSALPGLAVTTDVIAGFSGETEADALDTLHACERMGFAKLHVFRYSERTGTVAASMPQLPPEIRAARAAALRELGERMRIEFIQSRLGNQAEVLIERLLGPNLAEGTTPDYLRVRVSVSSGTRVGSIVKAHLRSLDGEVVLGQLV